MLDTSFLRSSVDGVLNAGGVLQYNLFSHKLFIIKDILSQSLIKLNRNEKRYHFGVMQLIKYSMDSIALSGTSSTSSDNEKSAPNEAGATRPFLCLK